MKRHWRNRHLDPGIFAGESLPADSTDDWRPVARTWEAHARSDPLWAVFSEPGKRGRKWDVDAFLETGEEFIDKTLRRAAAVGARVHHGMAVNFGCGVGRLSRALSYRFDKVAGIDISETMIRIADSRRATGWPGLPPSPVASDWSRAYGCAAIGE